MNTLRNAIAMVLVALLSTAVLAQEKRRVANEGTIGDKWMLADGTTLATVVYPPALAGRGANVCIALGYLIGKDGTTSEFAVLKQWNSESGEKEPTDGFWQAFAQAGADAVSQWRFKARPGVGVVVPTYTVATLGFQGKEAIAPAELRSHCRIADLSDHLAHMKSSRFQRGDMNKQAEEQARIRLEQRLIEEQLRRANRSPSG